MYAKYTSFNFKISMNENLSFYFCYQLLYHIELPVNYRVYGFTVTKMLKSSDGMNTIIKGFLLLAAYLDFVWLNELCVRIDVVDILVPEGHPVAPVQGTNIVVHRHLHGVPVVFH